MKSRDLYDKVQRTYNIEKVVKDLVSEDVSTRRLAEVDLRKILEEVYQEAYEKGYDEGWDSGSSQGYDEGWASAMDEV